MPKWDAAPPMTVVDRVEEVEVLANAILGMGVASFDTETTSTDQYSCSPVLISVSLPTQEYWNPAWGDAAVFTEHKNKDGAQSDFQPQLGSRFVLDARKGELSNPIVAALGKVDVIAHNYKYDAHVLRRWWGVVPGAAGRVYDPMLMDFLHNENRFHDLKSTCSDYGVFDGLKPFGALFRKPTKKEDKLRYPDISPAEWAMLTKKEALLDYAALDPYVTYELFVHLRAELQAEIWYDPRTSEERTLWDYYLDVEEPYYRSIFYMETNGVLCTPSTLDKYRPGINEKLQKIRDYYFTLNGGPINIKSNKQLSKLLYEDFGLPVLEKTDGGASGIQAPSVKADVLEKLSENYSSIVSPLLDYSKLDKLLTGYVDGLGKHIKDTGRIHGNFNAHVAVTGRSSSSAPNLQNIAVKDEDEESVSEYDIREAFVPAEGNIYVVADYATLEVRIAAQVSGDENLIKALLDGLDLHSFTAHMMFGLDYDSIIAAKKAADPTPGQKHLVLMRKAAKALMFGILYGMGVFRLSKRLGISKDEAKTYIDSFYESYPRLLESKGYWTNFCEANGYVLTLANRKRRLPAIYSSNFGARARAERQLFNAIIQGSGADLMRDYMPGIINSSSLNKMGARLVLQVHDEVVVEVPEKYGEEAGVEVKNIMESSGAYVPWVVPLLVDAKLGHTWSEGK